MNELLHDATVFLLHKGKVDTLTFFSFNANIEELALHGRAFLFKEIMCAAYNKKVRHVPGA